MTVLDAHVPAGPLPEKWDRHRGELKLVSPANKRKYRILVVGSGLAGSSAAASLAELGYPVSVFCLNDSPRRAHSIAAQGGINAAKNYANDGDNVWRLFFDTIKGGDYRSREANVFRLAQISTSIIDQCVAQGVPFARDYGGMLVTRSFGGAQVSRTFYARGQTGQQLLLGAYGALMRQVRAGRVTLFPRREMQELIVVDGAARGIITRNLLDGTLEAHVGDAVILATGGYTNVFFLSTNAQSSNVSAAWRAHRHGALFANPAYTQIHPTCIPVSGHHQSKLVLMSESLRNDGRVWVPQQRQDPRPPHEIPESERYYYLEQKYPRFGNLVPRDVASRNAKAMIDEGRGVGPTGVAVYLDFEGAIKHQGRQVIEERYGNLFDMYAKITADDPYRTPMRIYPAPHYAMGGLWVDYDLMTTIPGLFAAGEANFSDHGANRLGASALMQGLGDGYFIIPYTIGGYLADRVPGADGAAVNAAAADSKRAVEARIGRLLAVRGQRAPQDFHRELGLLLWNLCGMGRTAGGLTEALAAIPRIRAAFWQDVCVKGTANGLNQTLERAGRVADFLEFAELLVRDALAREESCGGHFREESQTEEGEALRDDSRFCHVAAWEYRGLDETPVRHQEMLTFESMALSQRSYK
jgi:succinate dehydrogenase / fumarate reductase, flavoprotein subunit